MLCTVTAHCSSFHCKLLFRQTIEICITTKIEICTIAVKVLYRQAFKVYSLEKEKKGMPDITEGSQNRKSMEVIKSKE